MSKIIRGAGGKGGGGGTEDDDTLFSASIGRVVEVISEGEIEGLLNGVSSIYFNGTPLVTGGVSNFDAVGWTSRNGGQDQKPIEGFPGVENTTSVNEEAKHVTEFVEGEPQYGIISPVIRDINVNQGVLDAIRVTVFTPALVDADNDKGNIKGSKVQFKIFLRRNGGSWELRKEETFDGKSTAKYERSYRIDIDPNWTNMSTLGIKLERVTFSPTSVKVQNKIFLGSYTLIIDNKLTYPNSALVATEVDARHFSSIPKRGYEIKGLKIKVPSNYTPYDPGHCTLEGYRRQDTCESAGGDWTGTAAPATLYNGYWDGDFDIKWTNNPAWVLYDLCTDTRYGLGNWLEENQMDKWALYEIARYCDAVDENGDFVGVDDGWGNKEARYTCNLYLQNKREAYTVLNEVAAIFRGMLYWQEGKITPVMDAPKDPIMLFSNANVIDGAFNYEGSSVKVRHNVAKVSWNNPEDMYKRNVEYIEDVAGIGSTGRIYSIDINAAGCTSQGQAKRVGKWILYSERNETEVVSFSTGFEGVGVRPGDNIKVADPVRAGVRYGGRVAEGSTDTLIKLDNTVPVSVNKTYTMTIIHTEQACINTTDNLKVDNIPRCIGDNGAVESTYSNSESCNTAGFIWQEDEQELCIAAGLEWKPRMWAEAQSVPVFGSDIDVDEITVSTAFDTAPNVETMWILEELGDSGVEAQDFKVLSVRETDKNIIEITALKHLPSKYDHIEEDANLDRKSISKLPNPSEKIPQPTDLVISEELYFDSNNSLKNRATFSWEAPRICDDGALDCTGGDCYIENGAGTPTIQAGWSKQACLDYTPSLTAGYCTVGGVPDYTMTEAECPSGDWTAGTDISAVWVPKGTVYPYVHSYYVEWRRVTEGPENAQLNALSNWESLGETTSTQIYIDDAPAGRLEFRVKTRRIF